LVELVCDWICRSKSDQQQNPPSGNAPTAAVGNGCCILHISDITLYRGERLHPVVRTTCAITVGVARHLP
jgi:hypothetical protein